MIYHINAGVTEAVKPPIDMEKNEMQKFILHIDMCGDDYHELAGLMRIMIGTVDPFVSINRRWSE